MVEMFNSFFVAKTLGVCAYTETDFQKQIHMEKYSQE